MANEIKPGDLVKLKSGGPKMTADLIGSRTELVTCKFFVGNEPKQMQCYLSSLEKVD